MGYIGLGYKSYDDYLQSNQFANVRKMAWEASGKCCEVCGKKFSLQPHHLSYELLGRVGEWRSIVFLCNQHHRACHYILWFFRIPLTPRKLYLRFLFVKYRHKVLHGLWRICTFLWFSFTVYENKAKKRRAYHRPDS